MIDPMCELTATTEGNCLVHDKLVEPGHIWEETHKQVDPSVLIPTKESRLGRLKTGLAHCIHAQLTWPALELTLLLLGYQGLTTASAAVVGTQSTLSNTQIAAALTLLMVPIAFAVVVALLMCRLSKNVRFDEAKDAWVDVKLGSRHVDKFGLLFSDYKSVRVAQWFGFVAIFKMLVVGVVIGVVTAVEFQGHLLLGAELTFFAMVLFARPFPSAKENILAICAMLSELLPTAIALFGPKDAETCQLGGSWQMALMATAFFGVAVQFLGMLQEAGALVWPACKWAACCARRWFCNSKADGREETGSGGTEKTGDAHVRVGTGRAGSLNPTLLRGISIES